ncbi:hypothetical protein [Acetobacterium woodii]|uniref:hypothetical protein n=1 Tax=Acetobacterium woodii TaxID=33952 RepID=UPI00031D2006|nr:hypothetical protein [Acetobacterium woodii]
MLDNFVGYTGLIQLLNDGTTALMFLSVPATALFIGYFAFQRSQADEMDQKMWGKRMKNALISGVAVLLSSSLVNVAFAYFKA